jgi:hypothetical protein
MSKEDKKVLKRIEKGMGVVGKDYFEKAVLEKEIELRRLKAIQTKLLNKLKGLREDSGNNCQVMDEYLLLHQDLIYSASHPLSHLKVPLFHRFDRPYWSVPYQETDGVVVTTCLSDQLEVWAGPLSRLELGLRALMVDMAMQVYAKELLKTDRIAADIVTQEFPDASLVRRSKMITEKQRQIEAQLLLAMAHSFREEYVVALAFATPEGDEGPKHLVGSIGAARGRTDRTLFQTRGLDGAGEDNLMNVSSLPTNTALNYSLNEVGKTLADIAEKKFVEITRLNVASKALCSTLGVSSRAEISQALMYLIHEAVQQNFQQVEFEIFNTQPELYRLIRQLGLPSQIISDDDSIQPTQLVLESVHGHYFQRTPPVPQILKVTEAADRARQFFTHKP